MQLFFSPYFKGFIFKKREEKKNTKNGQN